MPQNTTSTTSARVRCSRCANEGEWRSYMRCSRCKSSIYCSNECQVSDWPYHKTNCKPATQEPRFPSQNVLGVTIACNADRARGARAFEVKVIDSSHAMHANWIICPMFHQVGLPLLMFRHTVDDPASMTREFGLDNQIATHLLTHPSTGHPEERWQRAGCLGTVTVIRQDGNPLTFEAIETALMFADHVLGLFRDGVSPSYLLNPSGFQRFCQRYKDERTLAGHTGFQNMAVPL